MKIHTLWGWRNGEEFPELMEAWDDYTVDMNYDGWCAACERARQSWGGDLRQWREILLTVSDTRIVEAFASAEIETT